MGNRRLIVAIATTAAQNGFSFPPIPQLLDSLSAKAVRGTPPVSESLPGIASIADVPLRRIPELLGQLLPGAGQRTDCIITAFDYDRAKTVLFRSHAVTGAPGAIDDLIDITVAEAIDASSNAPVAYFDTPAAVSGTVISCVPVLCG